MFLSRVAGNQPFYTQFYFLIVLVLRVSLSTMYDDYVQFQVGKTLWLTGHKGKEKWNGNLYSLSLNVVSVLFPF